MTDQTKRWWILGIIGLILFFVWMNPASRRSVEERDNCLITDDASIRKYYTMARAMTDEERVVIARHAIAAEEALCRQWRDAKPTPLPPELKALQDRGNR